MVILNSDEIHVALGQRLKGYLVSLARILKCILQLSQISRELRSSLPPTPTPLKYSFYSVAF